MDIQVEITYTHDNKPKQEEDGIGGNHTYETKPLIIKIKGGILEINLKPGETIATILQDIKTSSTRDVDGIPVNFIPDSDEVAHPSIMEIITAINNYVECIGSHPTYFFPSIIHANSLPEMPEGYNNKTTNIEPITPDDNKPQQHLEFTQSGVPMPIKDEVMPVRVGTQNFNVRIDKSSELKFLQEEYIHEPSGDIENINLNVNQVRPLQSLLKILSYSQMDYHIPAFENLIELVKNDLQVTGDQHAWYEGEANKGNPNVVPPNTFLRIDDVRALVDIYIHYGVDTFRMITGRFAETNFEASFNLAETAFSRMSMHAWSALIKAYMDGKLDTPVEMSLDKVEEAMRKVLHKRGKLPPEQIDNFVNELLSEYKNLVKEA